MYPVFTVSTPPLKTPLIAFVMPLSSAIPHARTTSWPLAGVKKPPRLLEGDSNYVRAQCAWNILEPNF